MAERLKPNPEIIANREQCEGALAEMAQIDRQLLSIELDLQETIDLAKTKASQNSIALNARKKELADAVTVFGKMNKEELFTKHKSLDLGFGIIGFRESASIEQMKNVSAGTSIEKMEQYGFLEGIKTTKTVNKSAMTGWSDEKLTTIGLVRKHKNQFFIEIKKDDVPNVA